MRARWRVLWENLRVSYWFAPGVMAAAALLVAELALQLDAAVPNYHDRDVWYLFQSDAAQARALMLAVVQTAVGTLIALFTLTLVPLTIAATQLGPRLLRNFLRDTITQLTLGTFTALLVYALAVMLALPNEAPPALVPQISVSFGLLLAVLGTGLLVYFIHHLSVSIQASNVIKEVGSELDSLIQATYTRPRASSPPAQPLDHALGPGEAGQSQIAAAGAVGYVRAIDTERLLLLAERHDLIIRLLRQPGDFVALGDHLALISPGEGCTPALIAELNRAYLLGEYRTMAQDIEFGVNSLVEVAVRALSPAINDPFTAMTCLDRLGAALSHVAEHQPPPAELYGQAGELRVILSTQSFERLSDAAFHLIRQYGRTNADVLIRMLVTIARVAAHAAADDRAILRRHAEWIVAEAEIGLPATWDRERVRRAYLEALATLQATPATPPPPP